MKALCWLHRPMSSMSQASIKPRHRKLIAVETEIYSPSINSDIHYRGYPLRQLVKQSTITDVAHLLLKKDLPDVESRQEFINRMNEGINLLPSSIHTLHGLMPPEANVTDVLMASLSFLEMDSNPEELAYEAVCGQCLAIMSQWHCKTSDNIPSTENPIVDFILHILGSSTNNSLDSETKELLNTIAILYTDHGLTNASYAARLCTTERGSVYSSLISALAAHKKCIPMFSWQNYKAFINASNIEINTLLKTLHEEKRLPKPFRDFVHPSKDPRTVILMEHCDHEKIVELTEIDNKFDRKCHLRFDVFVYHLMRRLFHDDPEKALVAMRIVILVPRILGWLAHIAEQKEVKRTIQHIAAYVGPPPRSIDS
ncbi:Citrate synthase family protein [Babesia bovis T2Bo]|uniref:Citrate synthase family protein n=1 Tax=Babesia bovis T2Bo TaxID=484906 RepID=UPI001C35C892|nr:Citrate synthase family protein [Babesia bovis T2Bo]KAG6440051.1 Citrate synthase family protein [Babesia bovis T2Bo]